jgi:phosphonate transport system ATP-binding protein
VLELQSISKRFGTKTAVDNVSLKIANGSFLGVIGRSGAGKSTVLRMINRLMDPSDGSILFDDEDVTALKGQALRNWRSDCAMIFQQFNLSGRLDVLTNVLAGRLNKTSALSSLLRLWTQEDKAIALAALEQFDIASFASQRAESLSGGQQQRVAIARALVQEPRLILADEPIASLDPRNTRIVMDALQRINREFGITVICNLHSLDLARSYCDRLVGMANGKVVFDGVPEQLTDAVARELYGIEADEVLDAETDVAVGADPALQPLPVRARMAAAA